MKILHINTFDVYGGAERIAYDLTHGEEFDANLMVREKFSDSTKVKELPKYFTDKIFKTADSILWNLKIKKKFRQCFSIGEEYNFTFNKLKKLKEYQDCEIVHLHNLHGGYFDLDALIPIAKEKKIVWTLQDMWIMTGGEVHTFENNNFIKGIGRTPYNKIYPMNSPVVDRRQFYLEKKKNILNEIAGNTIFVPVSNWLTSSFESSYVFNKKIKSQVIYNGIDSQTFRNYNHRNWNKPRILVFNNDSPFRKPDYVFEVLKPFKNDIELFVVGKKPKNIEVEFYSDNIDDKKKLAEIYNKVDVLIFPSLADSCPLTVMEAMSCGVYVMATNVGGISELITNETGILFDIKNSDDLVAKFNFTINNLKEIRIKGNSAVERVKEFFSTTLMFKNYRSVYNQLNVV